jgi:site-specific recombinase XerD
MNARRLRYHVTLLNKYLDKKIENGSLNKKYRPKYQSVIKTLSVALEEKGFDSNPSKVTEDAINYLRNNVLNAISPKYARWKISIFGAYLAYHDNLVIEKMMIVWPLDSRATVDCLSPEESIAMLDAARTPLEKMIVHLELILGERQVELIRAKSKHFRASGKLGNIDVHGKGRAGGKWRTISFAVDTNTVLDLYLKERNRLIEEARLLDPNVTIPEDLLIYRRGKKLGSYKETAIDNHIQEIAKRAGIERRIGNHTMRRACGRNQHLAKVPIEEISANYGHEDTKQTIDYLNLTVDDLGKAQETTHKFLEQVRKQMKRDKNEKPKRLGKRV